MALRLDPRLDLGFHRRHPRRQIGDVGACVSLADESVAELHDQWVVRIGNAGERDEQLVDLRRAALLLGRCPVRRLDRASQPLQQKRRTLRPSRGQRRLGDLLDPLHLVGLDAAVGSQPAGDAHHRFGVGLPLCTAVLTARGGRAVPGDLEQPVEAGAVRPRVAAADPERGHERGLPPGVDSSGNLGLDMRHLPGDARSELRHLRARDVARHIGNRDVRDAGVVHRAQLPGLARQAAQAQERDLGPRTRLGQPLRLEPGSDNGRVLDDDVPVALRAAHRPLTILLRYGIRNRTTVIRLPRRMRPVDAVICVRGLQKSYGAIEAVAGIDLTVERGEIFAFLGPNGAGKTTTVEILEGFRARTAGEVSVLGVDPANGDGAWRDRLGVVLQESQPDPGLTVRECLELYAGYYSRPRDIAETIALVGLEEKAGTIGERLSGGQRRRLDVALALVGDPELIFLDEPTTGFDPSARRAAWEVVAGLRALGKTIFLTTHYMDEAEQLADRIAVIAAGRIVAEGTPGMLGGREQMPATIRFTLPDSLGLDALPPALRECAGWDDAKVLIETDRPLAAVRELADWALGRGLDLPDLDVRRPSL